MKFTKREMPGKGEGNGGGLFLKFKDGETKTLVLRGEIYEFRQKWENGKSILVDESDREGKSRFRVNAVVFEDGKFQAKILEFGLMLYNQFHDIAEEFDITKVKIKVSRRGLSTDTTYNALPTLKEPLSPNQLNNIENVPLNVLEHKDAPQKSKPAVKNHAPGADTPPPWEDPDDESKGYF